MMEEWARGYAVFEIREAFCGKARSSKESSPINRAEFGMELTPFQHIYTLPPLQRIWIDLCEFVFGPETFQQLWQAELSGEPLDITSIGSTMRYRIWVRPEPVFWNADPRTALLYKHTTTAVITGITGHID